MAFAPVVITAVSAVVSAVGALRQGRAQKRAADFNSKTAERNALISRQQARQEANQIQRQNRLREGAIRASIGGAGIRQQGSAIAVLGDIVAQGELERQNALYVGELRAIGFEDSALLERQRGKDALVASRFKAGAALLKGGSQAFTQFEDITGGKEEDEEEEEDTKLRRLG